MPPRARLSSTERRKAEYLAYREQARRCAHGMLGVVHEARGVVGRPVAGVLSVPEQAEVLMVEDGAFVEARIWVPRAAIEEG